MIQPIEHEPLVKFERHNRVNIHRHLREDVVVLLPHLAYRNGTIGYGDGAIFHRTESNAIGDAILRMLDHCATADIGPLEEKRDAAMERMRQGFELSYDEQFPTFGIPNNWGRIYERFPSLLSNPWLSSCYFDDADISDCTDRQLLTFVQLQLRRKDRGIYTTADSMRIDRSLGPEGVGSAISDRLDSWRPRRGFVARLMG